MANDLYSTLPGIQVTPNEVLEAELLAQQILQANYPDLDLREGTALRDLTIRPGATLLAILKKASDFHFAQNTIAGVDNSSSTDILDNILSNWFLQRKLGTQAIINARFFFARQKNVTVTTDLFFSPDNTLKYFPTSSITYPSTVLTLDIFSQEYYIDLDLQAEAQGLEYNISSGSLLYFSNFDPYFLRAEINYLKSASSTTETNTQFIDRASTAISTRNLINVPSIVSNLAANFNFITDIQPIGHGDPEMWRDLVQVEVPGVGTPVQIHIGGKVDAYCQTPLTSTVVQFTADGSGDISITGPVYSIVRSQISGGEDPDTIALTVDQTVNSLTSSLLVATANVTGHGYTTGTVVTISGAVPSGYNGSFVITNTGVNTFTYAIATTLTSPATGTIISSVPLPYTVSNPNAITVSLTSLTSSSLIATGTTATPHGLLPGRYVTIAGATPAGYNGSFLVISTTETTFTYAIATTLSSPASGSITAKAVSPIVDFGFSNSQEITVSFGGGAANDTASFILNYFQDIDSIQAYLDSSANRVMCGDYLARAFNIYALDVTITAYNGPSPDSVLCSQVVAAYLGGLKPGALFVMADLLANLFAVGITTIQTPLTITYNQYTRDLLPPFTGTIVDILNPEDRTAVFILNSITTNNISA